jgi:hypothetical protein
MSGACDSAFAKGRNITWVRTELGNDMSQTTWRSFSDDDDGSGCSSRLLLLLLLLLRRRSSATGPRYRGSTIVWLSSEDVLPSRSPGWKPPSKVARRTSTATIDTTTAACFLYWFCAVVASLAAASMVMGRQEETRKKKYETYDPRPLQVHGTRILPSRRTLLACHVLCCSSMPIIRLFSCDRRQVACLGPSTICSHTKFQSDSRRALQLGRQKGARDACYCERCAQKSNVVRLHVEARP